MMKKLSLSIGLFFMLMFSVMSINAVNINLTSCLQTITSGNTYYINLTNPDITGGTYCFSGNDVVGSTFIQVNDKITIDVLGNFNFFQVAGGNNAASDSFTSNNIQEFNVEFMNQLGLKTFFGNAGRSQMDSNIFTNSHFKGGHYLRIQSTTGGSSRFHRIQSNSFINSSIINTDYIFSISGDGFVQGRVIKFTSFTDSILAPRIQSFISFLASIATSTTLTNSVATKLVGGTAITNTHSIILGQTDVDVNDDSVGDVSGYAIYLELQGINFFQDFNEGFDIYSTFANNNLPNVYVNAETLPNVAPYNRAKVTDNLNGEVSDFLGLIQVNTRQGLEIVKGIDCTLFSSNLCTIQDELSFNQITTGEYRPLVIIGTNALINNVNFKKISSNNNNQLIGINLDLTNNNISFTNNVFERSDGLSKTGTIDSNHLIKLKGNQLILKDNVFDLLSASTATIYELLDIKGTNANNNIVNKNTFNNNIVGVLNPSEIFTLNAVTKFYNNMVGTNMVITNNAGLSSQLLSTPLIGYLHTDGLIYYYNVGNFYADNVGCVDANTDGFCDSSYTSGVITDTSPLSSYPFDYTQHLFTTVIPPVNPTSGVVTTTQPTSLQVFNLASVNDVITLGFNHNSDFPDLTCDFVVDGVSIPAATITNTPKNIEQTTDLTGWTTKDYTYRSECVNGLTFIQSTEITFSVNVAGIGGNQTNNTTTTTITDSPVADIGVDILDFDPKTGIENTNANALGFISDIGSFIVSIGVPLAILIAVIMVVLAALRLMF